MSLKSYQKEFIEFALNNNVLYFGQFTLKSGRLSPYFFNAGKFDTGKSLSQLGKYYAHAIVDQIKNSGLRFDGLFGPAYKGIPLVSATSIALSLVGEQDSEIDVGPVPYTFNRKEKKDHGEGGSIVGADIKGKRVLIIDDVITAGTAIRESFEIIKAAGGEVAGVVVAIDRQEKGKDTDKSAIQEIRSQYNIPVITVVDLASIVKYLEEQKTEKETDNTELIERMKEYRKTYGASESD
ncbi:hypothetical protein H4219_003436 [Mycoemilia scoparia]|uniref:orotate phosphoribosyltransferase n=1 Tax=Mycoemilia scoparia TaxID=417184 RepID=A0A9W8A2R9_9FUNG|nr:hypothetical protein H4219_003436 [Mycoemilia scoparia]